MSCQANQPAATPTGAAANAHRRLPRYVPLVLGRVSTDFLLSEWFDE